MASHDGRLRVRIIGRGRAGGALHTALAAERTLEMLPLLGRGDDLTGAASATDMLVVAVPDSAIARVAEAVSPVADTVVVHLSGATTLDALLPHVRRASLHPLVTISDPLEGARLLDGAWMAVAGDATVGLLAEALHGKVIRIAEADRARYHATAAIASNHLIALLGQVERIAGGLGVPLESFFDLASSALANARRLGPEAALTGPVARGDWEVVARHIAALPRDETGTYVALAREAARLAGRTLPDRLRAAEERG